MEDNFTNIMQINNLSPPEMHQTELEKESCLSLAFSRQFYPDTNTGGYWNTKWLSCLAVWLVLWFKSKDRRWTFEQLKNWGKLAVNPNFEEGNYHGFTMEKDHGKQTEEERATRRWKWNWESCVSSVLRSQSFVLEPKSPAVHAEKTHSHITLETI